jgi:hypothetical protein
LDIPFPLYFAGSSEQWGGATCFIDTAENVATPALARAYLITWGQFEDVVAQENARPTTPIELARRELVEGFGRALGPGRYDNLLCVGRMEGSPVLTFTSPWAMATADQKLGLDAPSPAYLKMLTSGLRESRAMTDDALVAYLGAAPGCSEDLVVSALGRSLR